MNLAKLAVKKCGLMVMTSVFLGFFASQSWAVDIVHFLNVGATDDGEATVLRLYPDKARVVVPQDQNLILVMSVAYEGVIEVKKCDQDSLSECADVTSATWTNLSNGEGVVPGGIYGLYNEGNNIAWAFVPKSTQIDVFDENLRANLIAAVTDELADVISVKDSDLIPHINAYIERTINGLSENTVATALAYPRATAKVAEFIERGFDYLEKIQNNNDLSPEKKEEYRLKLATRTAEAIEKFFLNNVNIYPPVN